MGEPAESAPRRRPPLAEAVRLIRARAGMSERWLMVAGGVAIPLGILAVLVGWWGASHTPNLYEQIPYMISGGLLGVALVVAGGFFYFSHWLTEMARQAQRQSAELLAAVERLGDRVDHGAGPTVNGHGGGVRLVATTRGTLFHRPACAVVVGKRGLRSVVPDEGLEPCRLCDPLGGAR